MTLTEEQKARIHLLDTDEFKRDQYEGLDEKTRKELGQFYTPARVCIRMIEKFKCDTLKGKTILDPTCGSGNLLIACLLAGADSDKVFGNEYDARAVKLCKDRLKRTCEILGIPNVPDANIHRGNALQARCLTEFDQTYLSNYDPKGIDDLTYAQGKDGNGNTLSWAEENRRLKNRLDKPTQLTLF